VTGKVTLNGDLLPGAVITFTSVDGGRSSGGIIKNGEYVVDDVSPGKNVVTIATGFPVTEDRVPEFMAQKGKWTRMQQLGFQNPAEAKRQAEEEGLDLISPATLGNSQVREIAEGSDTIDVNLVTRSKKNK
jgi:hypothetical protein